MINTPQDPNRFLTRLRQAPWRARAQGTTLVLAAVVLVVVIGALYLAQASRTAAAGRRLQDLERRRQQLEQENAQLRAEIAALRSVPRLIREAEALGYHQASASEVEYLPVRGVAAPPAHPVPEAEESSISPAASVEAEIIEYDETLESYLSDRLTDFREQVGAFFRNTFAREEPPATAEPTVEATRVP